MPTRQAKKPQRPRPLETLAVIHPNAAGLDIGSREIWASVPSDRDVEPVRRFGTFTPDLERLVDWLAKCHIDTVAMESTGVYWIPVFEMLEAHAIQAALVEPRQLKRVPGRKSDYLDCQWIQKLHSLGMLTASFRPDAEMRTLRIYLRHRAELLERRAPHILHMQKALQQMNLQLHHVLSDVTGVTGLKIVRAIVSGERNPLKLAQLRNPACKSSTDKIAQALTGTWMAEHLFVLRQSLEVYDFYTRQVAECDAVIERQFTTLKPRWEAEVPADLPPLKPDSHSKNQPSLRTRAELLRVTGVDLVAVHGISASLAQTILCEIGTDMSKWPTEKHFASWLGLAPHNDVSGGKILRSRTLPTDNRAGQAFRQAAASVSRSQCAFGAYYRRKKTHLGPMPALVATAHKIARTVYYMLRHHVAYHDIGAAQYDRTQQERELLYLKKKAARLGFTLTPHEPVPIAGLV
jgi:transposase